MNKKTWTVSAAGTVMLSAAAVNPFAVCSAEKEHASQLVPGTIPVPKRGDFDGF